jgi:peptide/nickel transport system permease protein
MATSQISSPNQIASLAEETHASDSLTRLALRRLRRDYLTLAAMGVLFLLVILSIAAPLITNALHVSYTDTSPTEKFLPVGTGSHVLGTDNLGRDLFSRLLYGGQVSLRIAFFASILSTTIGVAIGLVAGYYQGGPFGFIDDIIMWFITTLNSIPTLMLLILIASVLTPSVETLILVLTILSWTGTMRLVRGETLANREREYIISAKALGAGPIRVMFMHILPNVFSVLITALAIEIGTLILVESALSFLGLGVRPPTPSWGNMLTGAQTYLRQGAHLAIFPGLMIVLTVLSLYLIGDGVRDAFDPRNTK